MNKVISLLLLCLCSLAAFSQKDKAITIGTLLDEMMSVEEGARMPAVPYTCLQSSSYDRRSVSPEQPGWFANDDGYGVMRVDTTRFGLERVMLDADGPGVITRFWITAIDKHGTIRFYFDNATEPSLTIPAYDLMRFGISGMEGGLLLPHTSYEPDGVGGSTLFLPIPYQKHCKVTFTYREGDDLTPRYYHFNYRKYPASTRVETFSMQQVEHFKNKIETVSQRLQNPTLPYGLTPITSTGVIPPHGSNIMELPKGNNGIYELQIQLNGVTEEEYAQAIRDVFIKISFDGKQTVSAPLSDFACAGMGGQKVKSFYIDCDGKGSVTSRWFMPYRKKAQIELTNTSPNPIGLSISAKVKPQKWDKRNMYFHAFWHQQPQVDITTFDRSDDFAIDWNMVSLKGKGVYKGDMLTLYNYTKAWYGEGDEKIYVDGETFPSHFGTGTEDYYNCSWAPVVVFQTPFGGAPREDIACSLGFNTFFRTRHLDAIPFQKSLNFNLEMLGWQNGKADVAATTIWYGDLNTRPTISYPHQNERYVLPPVPDDPAKWQRKGAIEIEDFDLTEAPADVLIEKQNMLNWDGNWSHGRQFFCINGKPGQRFTFDIPAQTGSRRLLLYATKAADYGKISLSVNESEPVMFNGYSQKVVVSEPVDLGIHTAKDGKYTLSITIEGTDDRSVGARYMWGLDCIVAEE